MNGKIIYDTPLTRTVEIETSATLANSYIDGGTGFKMDWNKDSGDKFNW